MTRAPVSILIVLHDFALGGTERIALRLARAWAARGVAVTVLAGSEAGPLRPLAGTAVEIVVADPAIPRGRGSRRRLGRAARALANRRAFDIVFVPGNYHWPIVRALADGGGAIVAQISATLRKPQRGPLRQWAFDRRMRSLLRRADAVVALSDTARDQADRILRRRVAVTIALPALAEEAPCPSPVPTTSPPIVLAAGRLVPEKGFARLIEAVAALPPGTARLVIVGSGPQAAHLRALSEELGIADRVELPGYVPDIRPWLDRARLFVLASAFEGYPAVLIEALAAGRPVVATDCSPATRLLATPGAGTVVPLDDSAALSSAITAMLTAPPPDPARLAALVAHHRIRAVATAYLDLFATVRS